MGLTKNQLIDEMSGRGAGDRSQVRNMLEILADVAYDELEAGEDFVIPSIAKVFWRYTKPQKKGDRFKKGDKVTGFGGVSRVADADSPAVKQKATLKSNPTGDIGKLKPRTNEEAQNDFFKSDTGKSLATRFAA